MLPTWDEPEEISRIEWINIEEPFEKKTAHPALPNT